MGRALVWAALLLSGCGTITTRMYLEPAMTCADWDAPREAWAGEAADAEAALSALEIPEIDWDGAAGEATEFVRGLSTTVRVEAADGDWSFISRDVPEGTRVGTYGPFQEADPSHLSSCPQGDVAVFLGEAEIVFTRDTEVLRWTQPARVERNPEGTLWLAIGGGWADSVPTPWAAHLDAMMEDGAERTQAGIGLSGRLADEGSGQVHLSVAGRGDDIHYSATLLHGTWGSP